MPSPAKRGRLMLAAGIGTALVCLLLAELVLRVVLFVQVGNPAQEYHQFGYYREPLQGFELFAGMRARRFDKLRTTMSTNSRGLRGAHEFGEKEPGALRGAVMGGSCAFGYSATSDETTIAGMIGRRFENLEMINAGVPGYISYQALAKLQLKVIDLEPDFVVLYMGWNDYFFSSLATPFVRNTFFARDRYFAFSSWQAFIESKNAGVSPALLRRFAITIFVNRAAGSISKIFSKKDDGDATSGDWLVESAEVRAEIESQLRDNLLSMVGLLKVRGSKVLIVSLFSETDLYPKDRAAINGVLREVATFTGSEWIDADRIVRDEKRTGLNLESDRYHLTDAGNLLVADLVAERVAALFPAAKSAAGSRSGRSPEPSPSVTTASRR